MFVLILGNARRIFTSKMSNTKILSIDRLISPKLSNWMHRCGATAAKHEKMKFILKNCTFPKVKILYVSNVKFLLEMSYVSNVKFLLEIT